MKVTRYQSSILKCFNYMQGADVDSVDKTGCSPLLRAVSRGSINTAKLLIGKYGADCNLLDCSNRNILHLAVQSGKNLKAYGLVASEKVRL